MPAVRHRCAQGAGIPAQAGPSRGSDAGALALPLRRERLRSAVLLPEALAW